MISKKRLGWQFASLLMAGVMVLLWQAAADSGAIPTAFFPSPLKAWNALYFGLTKGKLLAMLLGTLERMATGWLLASFAGILLGALIGSSAVLRTYLQPTLELLRPLPASAVIPVAIALFGLSDVMALAVIAFGALWPTLLSTAHGFAAVTPRLYEVSRVLGLSRTAQVFKIALPSAMPDVLAGMRLSLTIALVLAVVCEMLSSRDGLGQWILMAGRRFRAADLFAGLLLLAGIGVLTAAILTFAEQRLLRWKNPH